MSIVVRCPSCSKKLKAPDSAAGKRAKCPQCGTVIKIPQPVYEAEEIPPEPDKSADDYEDYDDYGDPNDDYGGGDDDPFGLAGMDLNQYDSPAVPDRRPCPMCGEMIVASAAKCRFCGEVFDESISSSKKKRKRRGRADSETIRRFRREIHGLAGVWIFFGIVAFILGIVMLSIETRIGREEGPEFAVVLMLISAIWIVLGVFSGLKHVWAVYVGLVITYLSALGNIVNLNLCGLFVCACIIIQSHRVISMAGRLRDAGVPLTEQA